MDIIMIGISIEQADLALLGRVSFTDTAKLDMMNLLRERGIEAAVILSTCNRSEMYLSADAQKAAEAADLYRSFFHLPAEAQTDVLHGEAACRRLFEVCASTGSAALFAGAGRDGQALASYLFACAFLCPHDPQ